MTYEEFIQNILETRGRFGCGNKYHERHHIVPKSVGGSNDESNLIDLFAKEHYEAHRLLAEENPDVKQYWLAFYCMSTIKHNNRYVRDYEISADEYEELRKEASLRFSGENNPMYGIHNCGEKAGRYGKPFSEESKRKISEHHADVSGSNNPMYGRKRTKEEIEKIMNTKRANGTLVPKFSDEARKRMGASGKKRVGSKNPMAKKLYQYNQNGELIKIWDCIREFTNYVGLKTEGVVNSAIKKERPTKYGYFSLKQLSKEEVIKIYQNLSYSQRVALDLPILSSVDGEFFSYEDMAEFYHTTVYKLKHFLIQGSGSEKDRFKELEIKRLGAL